MSPGGRPVYAATYAALGRIVERGEWARRRTELLRGASGRVVEIGAGPGFNFAHYPASVSEVAATDPDPHMLRRARRAVASARVRVSLHRASAERLPFPAASFDAAVSTLVLCSVADPARALAEVRRVLKPGGGLLFLEHVRSPEPGLARWQDRLQPLWGFFAGGCHANRDTASALRSGGFELEELESFAFGPFPTRPHIVGIARSP